MRPGTYSILLALVFAGTLPATQAAASPSELLRAGRVDEVIASLQAELKSSPSGASYNYLARAYFAVEDWDRAISAAEKSVQMNTDNADYHLWLGRAYGEKAGQASWFSAMGLAKKTRREFERAVELDPNNVEARTALAEFYVDAPGIVGGGQDKARGQANTLVGLSPAKGHYVNGRLAEKNKDGAAAEKEYRAAIEASKGNANDWLNLALFYKHTNRLDEMERTLNQASNANATEEVLVECAEILVRTGRNLPAAGQLARRYISSKTLSEKSPLFKAHHLLGTVLEKEGDTEGAAREYQTALTLASNFSPSRQALNRLNK